MLVRFLIVNGEDSCTIDEWLSLGLISLACCHRRVVFCWHLFNDIVIFILKDHLREVDSVLNQTVLVPRRLFLPWWASLRRRFSYFNVLLNTDVMPSHLVVRDYLLNRFHVDFLFVRMPAFCIGNH